MAKYRMTGTVAPTSGDDGWEYDNPAAPPSAAAPDAEGWTYDQPAGAPVADPAQMAASDPGFQSWASRSMPKQRSTWEAMNTPIADLAFGDGTTKKVLGLGVNFDEEARKVQNETLHRASGSANDSFAVANTVKQMRAKGANAAQIAAYVRSQTQQQQEQGKRTWGEAINEFGNNAVSSGLDVASTFTSPVGALMQTAGKAGRVGKTLAGMAGAAFGVQGAQEMIGNSKHWYSPVTDPAMATFYGMGLTDTPPDTTPENLQRQLTGESMMAMGAHSAREVATGVKSFKGSLASRTIPDSGGMKTGDVYRTMRDNNVPMRTDQAGNGKFARVVGDSLENTPGSAGRMARFGEQQSDAYSTAVESMKDRLDPQGAGKDMSEQAQMAQEAATMSRDTAHDNAASLYRDIDEALQRKSGAPVVKWSRVKERAAELADKLDVGEEGLRPKEVINILRDIANGTDDYKWFETAHKDVSRLGKAQLSDSLVPGEGESALRLLAKEVKSAMEEAAKSQLNDTVVDGMKVKGHGYRNLWDRFQQAQGEWADYLDAYGSNKSGLRAMIGERDPMKVFDHIFGASKGRLRDLQLFKKYLPDWMPALKREFIRRLQDPKQSGIEGGQGKMWDRMLSKSTDPFLKELFTPEELKQLRELTMGGKMSKIDVNPSGSGRYKGALENGRLIATGVGSGVLGAVMGHPVIGALGATAAAGIPILSNAASRVMTSTPLNDFLFGYDAAAPSTRGSLASRTPNVNSNLGSALSNLPRQQGGTAIPNPFGQQQQGLRGVGRRRGGQAGAAPAAASGPLGWLIDAMLGNDKSPSKIKALTKKVQSVGKALDPKALPKTAAAIAKEHNSFVDTVGEGTWGGSTYHLSEGNMSGKDAFAVSVFPELQQKVEGVKVTPQQIQEYLSRPDVQAVLKADPRISVGTWASDGQTYLDLSATVPHLGEAKRIGKMYDQKAIFDLQNGREINVGGTGEGKVPEGAPAPIERLKDVKSPGTIDAAHWSTADDITELDPSHFNKDNFSSEGKRLKAYPGLAAPMTFMGERSKYRASNERAVIGRQNRYGAELNDSRFYDLTNDPDKLIQRAIDTAKSKGDYGEAAIFSHLDKIVRDEGYSGHVDSRGVIRSFDKIKVNKELIPEWADALLSPEERAGLTTEYRRQQFVNTLSKIPQVDEWVNAAKAGEIGRKWYERSNKAFDALMGEAPDYFGDGDRKRFADFVAATSPQQGVNLNLREALSTWKKWVDGDKRLKMDPRSTDPAKLQKFLDRELTMSRGKTGNAMKALLGEDMYPSIEKSKFFKVPNFSRNLNGLMNAVTNDSWMGLFSGISEREMPDPQHYHPISVMTRAAAKKLGWNNAEAQAAIWVFTRTLAEQSGWKSGAKRLVPREVLGQLTDEHLKQWADDFADIMRNDGEARSLMKKLGVKLDVLDQKLDALGHPEVSAGLGNTPKDSLVGVADRIERARAARDAAEAKPVEAEVPDDGTGFDPTQLEGEPQRERRTLPRRR